MYRSTLIAVNQQEDVARLPAGAALVAPGTRVQVVHVVRQPHQEAAGRQLVAEAVRRARALGMDAGGYVPTAGGEPVARRLAREVRDRSIELVVIGSRGLGSLGSLMRGGVSHDLVAGVGVTALVVPHQAEVPRPALRRVLAAVAGAADQTAIVDALRRLQGPHEITLAHVGPESEGLYPDADWPSSSALERARQRLHAHGRRAISRVLAGNVVEALGAAARDWDADLIVLGSRRPGDVAATLRGSTLHGLLRRGGRPLLVAPR
jgi:nucleotide-binding universal stress UspA family protein